LNDDMSERFPAVMAKIMGPVPQTERGYGIHMTSTSYQGGLFAYCHGRSVVVRSIADPTQIRIWSEHKVKVNVARFSPKGNFCASGDESGTLLVWELMKDGSFKSSKSYPINKSIKDIAWSDDGKRLAVAGNGGPGTQVKAILVDSGNTVGECVGHDAAVLAVDQRKVRPFRIVSGGEDRTIRFFEGPPFKFVKSFTGHENYVNCIRYSPDGSQYVSVSTDVKINLFDGTTGDLQKELKQSNANKHKGTIYSVSWSGDGKQLLTSSSDKTCKIWNVADDTCAATISFGEDIKKPEVEDMQVSTLWHADAKSGDAVMSVSLSGAINILNPSAPQEYKAIHGCMRNIKSLVVDRSARVAYTGEANGVITKWDLNTAYGKWFTGKKTDSAVVAMRLAPGNNLEVINLDDKMRVHSQNGTRSDDKKQTPLPIGGACRDLANSNNTPGMFAMVLASNKLVVVKEGKITQTQALDFEPQCVAFAHDDSVIYTGGKNKAVIAFALNSEAGTVTATDFKVPTFDTCEIIAVHPNGNQICAIDKKKSLNFYQIDNKDLLNSSDPLRLHDATVRAAAYSPNGSKLVTAGADGNVIVWYDGYGGHRLLIQAHYQAASQVAWLDETTIISAGDELTMKLWTIPAVWA